MALTPINASGSSPQSGIPTLNDPFVDSNGRITIAWFRFLLSLWRKFGGGQVGPAVTAYLVVNDTTGLVDVYSSLTNLKLGVIQYVPLRGGAGQPVATTTSPIIYTSTEVGNLLVSMGRVELARGSSPFQQISLVGGYFQLEPQDSIRVTWEDALSPPIVIFYPYS